MAIYKLIANGSFGPEEIKVMTQAYEEALIDLGIDRNDPLTELIAKALVNVTATGAIALTTIRLEARVKPQRV